MAVSLEPHPEGKKRGVKPLEESPLMVSPAPKMDGMFLIKVSDSGIGIKKEELPYIFERFFRADPSRGRSSGGSGIGLALVKELVYANGGEIRVQSSEGEGTTFYLYLPGEIG